MSNLPPVQTARASGEMPEVVSESPDCNGRITWHEPCIGYPSGNDWPGSGLRTLHPVVRSPGLLNPGRTCQ